MEDFKDVLLALDSADEVLRIELFDSDGDDAGVIHNKPGTQGSLKIYYHLYKMFGSISLDAAVEGVSLFAEHAEDATDNPGKHPNIDRLLDVIEYEDPLTMKVILA